MLVSIVGGAVFFIILNSFPFDISFRIRECFALRGSFYKIGSVRERVPVHGNAKAVVTISDSVFFQVRAVGGSSLADTLYLLAGFFIGDGNSNWNRSIWLCGVPSPADNGVSLEFIERAI